MYSLFKLVFGGELILVASGIELSTLQLVTVELRGFMLQRRFYILIAN